MNTNHHHQRQRRNTNSDSASGINGVTNLIIDNDENITNNQPQVPSFHPNGNETN